MQKQATTPSNERRLRRRLGEQTIHQDEIGLSVAAQRVADLPDFRTQRQSLGKRRLRGARVRLCDQLERSYCGGRHDSAAQAPSEKGGIVRNQFLRLLGCPPVERVCEVQADSSAEELRRCSEWIP